MREIAANALQPCHLTAPREVVQIEVLVAFRRDVVRANEQRPTCAVLSEMLDHSNLKLTINATVRCDPHHRFGHVLGRCKVCPLSCHVLLEGLDYSLAHQGSVDVPVANQIHSIPLFCRAILTKVQ